MPIYEYECDACGHRMEAIQRISEPPLTQCPECSAETLRKLVSAAGFRLKGSGWYVTDFRDKDKDKDKKPATPSGDKGASKSDSGTTESTSKAASTSTAASSSTPSAD